MPTEAVALDIYSVEPEVLLQMVNRAGGQRAFARKHGVKRTTLQNLLYRLRKDPFKHRPAPEARLVPVEDGVARFILTSAQDGTVVHEEFMTCLERYQEFLAEQGSCEIMVAGFTYNKSLFEDHSKKRRPIFAERVQPYLSNERVRLADVVDWCGEMNTLPTAVSPLSGFHTYTRHRWGIFPHAKLQLISVPTMKHSPPKMIMTTGAVTRPNYVPKKAGIKASFHHTYGAVLVEIAADGTFFCRHLIGDPEDGSFYDLDRCVTTEGVTTHHRLKALTPGDVHCAQIDPGVCLATFGFGPTPGEVRLPRKWQTDPGPSMLDELRPEHLFIHDVSDWRARNHHEVKDPHTQFRLHVEGVESVFDELKEVAMFLTVLGGRDDMQVVVVESNHDQALNKWLKTADYRIDQINAEFFLEAQRRSYAAIRQRDREFSIFADVMTNFYDEWRCDGVRFLREDESYEVGGVEHSNHGHRGPNGSRGSVVGLTKIAPKVTMGHVHSPGAQDGVFAGGTCTRRDLPYAKGPSSWANTHVAQYQSGHRALLTLQNGRWRL